MDEAINQDPEQKDQRLGVDPSGPQSVAEPSPGQQPSPRKPFAAKRRNALAGVLLLVLGGFSLLLSLVVFSGDVTDSVGEGIAVFLLFFVPAAGLGAWGAYLVRGEGADVLTTALPELKTRFRELKQRQKQELENIPPPSAPSNTRATTAAPSTTPSTNINIDLGSLIDNAAPSAQIKALSDPDTAKALQNLQNLLYTRTITEEEFHAAKSKLLGNH